jgi:hypothetical protein
MSLSESKCNKINIPFVKQEIQKYPINDISFNNYYLGKLDISYNDPTTLQFQKFKNTSISELRTNGKMIVDISGDICDTGDEVTIKGTLKIDNIISGPYRTEGGIIQFQRLFLHFDQLMIPIQIKYSYDINKICDPSLNIMKDISGFEVKLNNTSQNQIKFDNFFVTNALFETNRNEIFTGLVDEFKTTNGTFRGVYEDFISALKDSEIFMMTIKELNRIICLSKSESKKNLSRSILRNVPFSNEDEYYLSSNRYNDKIARLKDKGYLDLIFK